MSIKKYFSTLTILFCATVTYAQNQGKVTVVKDALIDSLIERRITLNKLASSNGTPILVSGYRVQVFFGTNRKEAYHEQARFKSMYPELNTYLSYTQPNYRVKAGDFRARSEAQKLMTELRSEFPTLFIFNELINPIKADEFNADK